MINPRLRVVLTNVVAFVPPLAAAAIATDLGFEWLHGSSFCRAPNPTALGTCRAVVRVEAVIAAFLVKLAIDVIEYQFPLFKLSDFRRDLTAEYITPLLLEFEALIGATPSRGLCRANVMVARRRWFFLFLQRQLTFVYSQGFQSTVEAPMSHRDKGIVLLSWQGLAGEAFSQEQFFSQLLDPMPQNPTTKFGLPWGMFPWQREKTAHVKWVLCVPMYYRRPGENRDLVRGVINIDVTTDAKLAAVADAKMKDGSLNPVLEKLLKFGATLAKMW